MEADTNKTASNNSNMVQTARNNSNMVQTAIEITKKFIDEQLQNSVFMDSYTWWSNNIIEVMNLNITYLIRNPYL